VLHKAHKHNGVAQIKSDLTCTLLHNLTLFLLRKMFTFPINCWISVLNFASKSCTYVFYLTPLIFSVTCLFTSFYFPFYFSGLPIISIFWLLLPSRKMARANTAAAASSWQQQLGILLVVHVSFRQGCMLIQLLLPPWTLMTTATTGSGLGWWWQLILLLLCLITLMTTDDSYYCCP